MTQGDGAVGADTKMAPSVLQTLGDLLVKTSGVAGAGVAVGRGAEPSFRLLCLAAAVTFFVAVVVPVLLALGRGLAACVERRFEDRRPQPHRVGAADVGHRLEALPSRRAEAAALGPGCACACERVEAQPPPDLMRA
jgi:hypothetical protein